jgi:hypothetical protein
VLPHRVEYEQTRTTLKNPLEDSRFSASLAAYDPDDFVLKIHSIKTRPASRAEIRASEDRPEVPSACGAYKAKL